MENNIIVKELLKDYEKKHQKALIDLENRKQTLYSRCPELLEIENKLHALGISTARFILGDNNSTHLTNLKNEIEKLKIEQTNLLKKLNIDENYLKPTYECNICNDTGYTYRELSNCYVLLLKTKIVRHWI